MEYFVNKWFPSQKPNLAARYDKNFTPPILQHKRSMDKLKEIDRKLDLLPEYLGYRADWLVKYEGYENAAMYFLDRNAVLLWEGEGRILTFQQWLNERSRSAIILGIKDNT